MSIYPQLVGTVPQDTARVVKAAFPKGNLYMHMRDVLGTIYDDEHFSHRSVTSVNKGKRKGRG